MSQKDEPRCDVRTHSAEAHEKQANSPREGNLHFTQLVRNFANLCPSLVKLLHRQPIILVLRQFPNEVRLVFKQFPLDMHAQAEFGAEAALAAQAQGKFWEMHDKLYAGFPDLSRKTVMRYAKEIGLDVNRFADDVDSRKFKARVHNEEQEGEVAGVGGTPTFFINGKKYNGVFDVASVGPLIKKELK